VGQLFRSIFYVSGQGQPTQRSKKETSADSTTKNLFFALESADSTTKKVFAALESADSTTKKTFFAPESADSTSKNVFAPLESADSCFAGYQKASQARISRLKLNVEHEQ
jgi:hypothetical protein